MSEGLGWSLRCAAVAADPCFGLRADGIRPCGCSGRQHAAALQGAGAQCAPYARCILQNHPASKRPAGPSLCLRPNDRPGSAAGASLPRWLCPFNRASAGVGILPDPQIRCPKDLLFTGRRSSSFAGVSENPPPRSCRRHHREGSPEPQVLGYFCLLFLQGKSRPPSGRGCPGYQIGSRNPRAGTARRRKQQLKKSPQWRTIQVQERKRKLPPEKKGQHQWSFN